MAVNNEAFVREAEKRIQRMKEDIISAKATKAQLDRTIEEKMAELKSYGIDSIEDVPNALSKNQEEIDAAVTELGTILERWDNDVE